MEFGQFISFVVDGFLFYLAFKIGQISGVVRSKELAKPNTQQIVNMVRSIITIEEINGIYYAYDGNDFLAQGATPNELVNSIINRFPKKYLDVRVMVKTKSH